MQIMGNYILLLLVLIIHTTRYGHCQQMLAAKMNSYNVQVTANSEGSMFKIRSPETDVKSMLKEPPQVQVEDATLPLALVTKLATNVMLTNPKMSVAGTLPAYSYKPAKLKPKVLNIVNVIHRLEPVVNSLTKDYRNSSSLVGVQQNITAHRPDLVKSFIKLNTSSMSIGINKNITAEMEFDLKEDDTENSGDDDDSSGDGTIVEKMKGKSREDQKNKALKFPPKAPEIPIELGLTGSTSNHVSSEKQSQKQINKIDKNKQKPCVEATCAESSNEGGGDGGKTEEEESPQPDIPIELGVVRMGGNAHHRGQEMKDSTQSSEYRVTYIDETTPRNFILIESNKKRKRRSISENHKISPRKRRRHHRRHHHHHHRHHHHKRHHHRGRKEFKERRHQRKRSNIMENKLEQFQQKNSVAASPIEKPVRSYLRTLAKDIRNVMGQAKQVLQNTGQVVHGLKRVLGGASELSTITNDAVKYAKYFNADVSNSSLEYMQEKAIVALITAEQSAKEAQDAASIAKSASEKANAAERRMDIASRYPQSANQLAQIADLTKTQAIQANKAFQFAANQRDKTRKVASFIDNTLKRMSKLMPVKANNIDTTGYKTREKMTTTKAVGKTKEHTPTVDSEYAEFSEEQHNQEKESTTRSESRKEPTISTSEFLKKQVEPFYLSQMKSENTKKNESKLESDSKSVESTKVRGKGFLFPKKIGDEKEDLNVKINGSNITIDNPKDSNASKKMKVVNRPIHLVPGEYTGFKRDEISHAEEDEADDSVPIKRFKTIGLPTAPDDDVEVPDYQTITLKIKNVTEADYRLLISKTKSNLTEINRKNVTVAHQGKKSDDEGSGSADDSFDTGIDVAQLLKAPISVSVHVVSSKDESTLKPRAMSEKHTDIEDPFGFRKQEKTKDTTDPFEFKTFMKQKGNIGENEVEEEANDRTTIASPVDKMKKPTVEWD